MKKQDIYLKNVVQCGFEKFINYYTNQSFLLAVSGGVDSVVLVHLFHSLNLKFHIAHINFQLRGEESCRDEFFVKSLAQSVQVPLKIERVDTKKIAIERKISIQEAARIIRYEYFEQWREKFSLHKVVTAHHIDDNVETILFRLFRGTRLKGLLGIPRENGHIIRPLLDCSKKDIIQYALQHQLTFVEDSSNREDKYTRNWIRRQLVPLIEQQFPNFKENIHNHLPFLQDTYQLYSDSIQQLLSRKIQETPQGKSISIAFLKNSIYSRLLFLELLLRYGFANKQIEELEKLTYAENGRYLKNQEFTIVKYEKKFLIFQVKKKFFSPLLIEKNCSQVESIVGEKLFLEYTDKHPSTFSKNLNQVSIDIQHIQFPLLWRKYKIGDYFYPLGMNKKKKIARFLIDQKIPLSQKEEVTVLEDAAKKVIWLVGFRLDDRFKIKLSTKHFLKIERQIKKEK
ncbi:MAG: tRNA lysidine(34) synthetase TilS [Chitinophagaceae bacterium]